MKNHIPHTIHWSDKIQHSYAIYGTMPPWTGCIPHRFPRDNHILREDAMVFHRDKFQDLIPRGLPKEHKTVFHTGDLGDIIACLPIFREMGGVHLRLGGVCGERTMRGPRFQAIKDLLTLQPYILSLEETDDNNVDYDFTDWRYFFNPNRLLTTSQAAFAGYDHIDMSPWLMNVEPDDKFIGCTLFARSARYHTQKPMWRRVIQNTRNPLFVGTPQEHLDFQRVHGVRLPYIPTGTLLDLARVIKGCETFYCNQSSPFWIAAGLGVNIVQEQFNLDSTIERPNAIYCPSEDSFLTHLNKTY
jgi:hypothetical protein